MTYSLHISPHSQLFRLSHIIPKEHGAWAILLAPFLAGTFAKGKPGIPTILLLICVISLYLLRVCGEFYLSNLIKKKESFQNLKSFSFYAFSNFALSLFTVIFLLFYFKLWNLLLLGFMAFLLFGLYYVLPFKNNYSRMSQQFIAILGLTLTAPAAYYVASGTWDYDTFLLWILNVIFFNLGFLYVHNRIDLYKKRTQVFKLSEKLWFSRNLVVAWCFSLLIFCALFFAGLIKPVFFLTLLPITIQIVAGLFFNKKELKIKKMGYSLVGQDILFLAILIYIFRIF